MATPDYVVSAWRTSSFSGTNGGNCVEVATAWRTSSFSGTNGDACVEVAVAWRTSSFSGSNGGDCVEVGPTAHAILVRDTKHRDGGTLAFPPATWRAFLPTR